MNDQTPERLNDISALFAEIDALTARCEALQLSNDEKHRHITLMEAREQEHIVELRARCEALTAERDTLRQKLSDADEIRVSFAAGYTAALDDVLNETPEPSHD